MDAEAESQPPLGESAAPLGRPLIIEQRTEGPVRVVTLIGSMQLDEAESVAARLPALVARDICHVILDLTRLEFINSSGISAIVATHRRARSLNGSVQVVGPRPQIRKLLEVTRLSEVVAIVDSVASALAAARRS